MANDFPPAPGPIEHDVLQGSDEWLMLRCGMLTASNIRLLLSPTLKLAKNEKQRAHLYELLAERITRHVEPGYVGDAMLRGYDDEDAARALYAHTYAPVRQIGLITNTRHGPTLGYSPDGLVGTDGLIEIKSRNQRLQVQSVLESLAHGVVPAEHLLQVQAGLLISERRWCDYLSYSDGMPMVCLRVYPDAAVQAAIIEAAQQFEAELTRCMESYNAALSKLFCVGTARTRREIAV